MTDRAESTYTCPECGEISGLTLWKSINVNLNPELKPLLLDGSLLTFTCPICSFTQGVSYPLLYHDPAARFMVWLMPGEDDGTDELNYTGFGKAARLMKGYRLRVADTFDRLLEKIFIFDNELDDRVLEILRSILLNSVFEKHGIYYDQLFYTRVDQTQPDPQIDLTIFFKDQAPRVYPIHGPDGYPRASEILHKKLNVPAVESPAWKQVGRDYMDKARSGQG